MYYLIKSGALPVCVVEVKPAYHLKKPRLRVDAYKQVVKRLDELFIDSTTTTKYVYGLSAIGNNFLIIKIHTCTTSMTPKLQRPGPNDAFEEVAPLEFWRNHVLKRAGVKRLVETVNSVKGLCATFPSPALEIDVPFEGDDDVSDTSSIDLEA